MPTAARLTAAIVFGALGVYFAFTASPYFPEAKEPSYWLMLNAAIGVLCGWIIAGTRAGLGWSPAVSNGITAGVAMLFWVFFLMSFHDMIKKSLRKLYDGPVEAVVNVFQIMMDWAQTFAIMELGIVMVAGSVICGLVTEFVKRRLP